MKDHNKIRTGEKPHKCKECEGNFSVLSSLCILIQDNTQNIMQTKTMEAHGSLVMVPCRDLDGPLVPQLTFKEKKLLLLLIAFILTIRKSDLKQSFWNLI